MLLYVSVVNQGRLVQPCRPRPPSGSIGHQIETVEYARSLYKGRVMLPVLSTSYQSAIVSIAVSCTIFEIFDVEECCDIQIQVKGHSPCKFMHDLYRTSVKFTHLVVSFCCLQYGSVVIHFYTASCRKSIQGKMGCCSHSVSFDIVEIGANRKPICDFLLVFPKVQQSALFYCIGWFRGSAVERWSLTGELSLSCARPTADG